MPGYYIFMGQGIVADIRQYTLCSGQFSTCAPIVMLNSETDVAGLYHYGGGALSTQKAKSLNILKTLVKPTVAWVLGGLDAEGDDSPFFAMSRSVARAHYEDVSAMFEHGTTVHKAFYDSEMRFHRRAFSSISIGYELGRRKMWHGLPGAYTKLQTTHAMESLPGDVTLIGEKDEAALSMWQ